MPEPEVATVDTSGSFGRVMADTIGKELPGAIAESKAQGAEMRRLGTETADRLERGQKKAEGLAAPPPPPPAPPPQMRNTSVTEQWGSVAMGLAMLGSAFTRRPAINALNAAAGVMKAYQAHDADEYKRNFERWKVETDYSLKMYQYQHDAYKDALDLIGKDQNTALAIMRTRAAALGDDPVKKLLEVGQLAQAESILREREARIPKLEEESRRAKVEGQLTGEVLSADKALRDNPTDPAAIERARKARQAVQDYDAATKASPTYGSNEQVMRDWHSDFVREHGREPTSAEETKQLGDLKKAESTAGAHQSVEFEIRDAQGKPVERVMLREGTAGDSAPIRTDRGKPEPLVLAPGQTIHKAPPGTEGRQMAQVASRLIGATTELVPSLRNLVELPIDANAGPFMGLQSVQPDSLKSAIARTAASHLVGEQARAVSQQFTGLQRQLAIIESQGSAQGLVGLTNANNVLVPQSGWSGTAVMRSYAEIAQIAEANIRAMDANPYVSKEQKKLLQDLKGEIREVIPYTVHDVNQLAFGGKKKFRESVSTFADKLIQTRKAEGGAAGGDSMPLPDWAKDDQDGMGYEKDGAVWVKRGDRLVKTPGAAATPP